MGDLIYFVGYVLAFIVTKKLCRTEFRPYTYAHVILAATLSLASWITFIVVGLAILIETLKDKTPPKWL